MTSLKRFYKIVSRRMKRAAPVILQQSDTECGAACLAMLFSYYNVHVSLNELREKCGISRDGCPASQLIKVATSYGFMAEAYWVQPEALHGLQHPVMAFWNFCHYVVINAVNQKIVSLNDPACGQCYINLQTLDRSFTGVIIDITPTSHMATIPNKNKRGSVIRGWLSGYKHDLTWLIICLMMLSCGQLVTTLINTLFVNQVLVGQHDAWLPYLSASTVLAAFVFGGNCLIHQWHLFKFNVSLCFIKTTQAIHHVLRLPTLFYALRHKSDIIASMAQVELISSALIKNMSGVWVNAVTLTTVILTMSLIDFSVTLAMMLLSCLLVICIFVLYRHQYYLEKSHVHLQGKLYSHAVSSLYNIESVKAGGFEQTVLKKWFGLFGHKLMLQDKLVLISSFVKAISHAISQFTLLTILWVGSFQVAHGRLSIGGLMALYGLYYFFSGSMANLTQQLKEMQAAWVGHDRVNDLVSLPEDPRFAAEQKIRTPDVKSNVIIQYTDLTFGYQRDSATVLSGLSGQIRAGEQVALVGSTGSGKSSLLKVLCGLYPFHSGSLTLFSEDIRSLSAACLSSYVAYVSQEVTLFSGTLYDNLSLWSPSVNPGLLNQAIEVACLSDVIKARGLYANVEGNGSNFSGGERQRIEIARAIIQDTPILVLDEATSALDDETERQLISNISMLNKTIIYVAHRLESIRHCDQIMVIESGHLVEQGRHEPLLQADGHYAALIKAKERIASC
ncbi:MAG: hypothetical protein A3E85_00620 [Gammaproteobacteria bacterium RIFCSPHIGHO2_12_FULL_45_12]|nr:MAG: hypothetical protein A3E85_00620 [Gammaproteobacteria bacterium RIFCSPHIGHO2_12_FULL_45_12]